MRVYLLSQDLISTPHGELNDDEFKFLSECSYSLKDFEEVFNDVKFDSDSDVIRII